MSAGGSDGAVAHGDDALDAGVVGALRASGPPHCKRTRVPRPALASPLASLGCATIFLDLFLLLPFASHFARVAPWAPPIEPAFFFSSSCACACVPHAQTDRHTRSITRLPSLAPLVLPPTDPPAGPPMGRGGTIPSRPSVRLHSLNAPAPARPSMGHASGGDPPTALQ